MFPFRFLSLIQKICRIIFLLDLPHLHILDVVVMEFDHEVVCERPEKPSDVGHNPGDPEEVVRRAECLLAKAGHQSQKTAAKRRRSESEEEAIKSS